MSKTRRHSFGRKNQRTEYSEWDFGEKPKRQVKKRKWHFDPAKDYSNDIEEGRKW